MQPRVSFLTLGDPDGYIWEVANNPFMPLDSKGRVTLPAPSA